MNYFCCDENRRNLVMERSGFNGIDHLEVVDKEFDSDDPFESGTKRDYRQRILRVFFLKDPPAAITGGGGNHPELVRIEGGERVAGIVVERAAWNAASTFLEVQTNMPGDYSTYTLRLHQANSDAPLAGMDAVLSSVDFSFKIECNTGFDCRTDCNCPSDPAQIPELDYLAKDYASFRQLMLDRMALIAPDWRERNPADLGITIVELFAYVGDYLSYRQDAIATEAYLGTARRRTSVRRHTRILDYAMHEGCSARAWVQVRVNAPTILPLAYQVDAEDNFRGKTGVLSISANEQELFRAPRFVTRLSSDPVLSEHEFQRLAGERPVEVFEPIESVPLFPEHNEMFFHTWGGARCCLPKGATKATLRGEFPQLRAGMVLIFAERKGPKTGDLADADPARRHAVRLTSAITGTDDLFQPPQPITEIQWASDDALPFALCLSSRTESGQAALDDVASAFGNIVLADHGRTIRETEKLPVVPRSNPALAPVHESACGHCAEEERFVAPPRYLPRILEAPLTFNAGYRSDHPASDAMRHEPSGALPAIRLRDSQGRTWTPALDLISSEAFSAEFVAEVENDGTTRLRFGDDENGLAPAENTDFQALYRFGGGSRGNIGSESLVQLAADFVLHADGNTGIAAKDRVLQVINWLPAKGGSDPEPLERARLDAPAALRVQQRAVTPADYAKRAESHPEVSRATGTLRWTGSWHTVFLTVDRKGGRPIDSAFEANLREHIEPFRMAGHDLEIDGPRYVPIELTLRVCVAPEYFRSDVVAALEKVFDNRVHPDGTRGFFHPDNFTFGQPLLLSRIYAAAQAVPGVRHVIVTLLRRQGDKTAELVPGDDSFEVGPLEIVQLDNDPNFPERGALKFEPAGGR